MLVKIFPFLLWFKGYKKQTLRVDFISGLTVAMVLIPQSMAYAQLAGLPPYYGLYAAFLPPLIAALFGSSNQLATGPVAIVSLMTAATLEPLATMGGEMFIAYAVLLAFMVGVFQFLLGILRLGLVINFLSHPVVNGFTTAAAIIIASSQLSNVFGVSVDKADYHYQTIIRVIQSAFDYSHLPTIGMAILAIVIMVGLRRLNQKLPNVLIAVVVTTVLSWAVGFHNDKRISIDDLASPAVREMVRDFNGTQVDYIRLSDARADLNEIIDKLQKQKNYNGMELIALENELAVLNFQLKENKHQAHLVRSKLRDLHFSAVTSQNNGLIFYSHNGVPVGVEADGRPWRLKISNKPLDENSLLIMGGGSVVGSIPEGIPRLSMPIIDFEIVSRLLTYAIIISLLGFMEAIAIAKAMAAKTGQKLNVNQELIGQGLANIIGSFGSSYPVSGSFSRSAVNLQSGAITGMSNVFSSLVVMITLLFFTPLLYHLPQAVLACVIMLAVIGLINIKGFVHAWKAKQSDGVISVISFLVTLGMAPNLELGIMVGVVLSLGVFLFQRMRPKVSRLSMDSVGVLRCVDSHNLGSCRHIAVLRFDGILFFVNSSFLDEEVFRIRSSSPDLRCLLLVAEGINGLDSSAEDALSLLVDRIRSSGVRFTMSRVKDSVRQVMERTGLLEKIGEENIYDSTEAAIQDISSRIHAEPGQEKGACRGCPLLTYVPRVETAEN